MFFTSASLAASCLQFAVFDPRGQTCLNKSLTTETLGYPTVKRNAKPLLLIPFKISLFLYSVEETNQQRGCAQSNTTETTSNGPFQSNVNTRPVLFFIFSHSFPKSLIPNYIAISKIGSEWMNAW